MDIFNRPPSISEDTLQYMLYPSQRSQDKASVISLAMGVREYVDGLLSNFIWHRDAFELKAAEDQDSKTWFLEGRMRVGDSIDDEWCTVWLLREISSKWDFAINVCDTDGEFLLIEAAEDLPSWVKPSNAENRVWIYNYRLHLIPLSHVSPPSRKRHHKKYRGNSESGEEDNYNEDDEYLAAEDAVRLVRDDTVNTLAPANVESNVWRRISGYPRMLQEHMHIAKGYVPVDIAKALLANPSLVQRAIEAFYTRDAIQLRAAHRMLRFPPSTSILRSIRMTRTAYAQLAGQKFFPPRIFGQWTEAEGSNEYKWKDIGMKIAVGFEMLYQESKGRSAAKEAAAEKSKAEADKDTLRRNADYIKYIEHLLSTGYFKGEKEGSKLWNDLETKAVKVFIDIRSSSQQSSFSRQVELAVSEAPFVGDPGLQEEDDESWLTINAEELDAQLEKTIGQAHKTVQDDNMDVDSPEVSKEDRMATEQATRLKDLANKVQQFVEGEGDIEGAHFEDEEFSDETLSDDLDMEDSDEESPRNWTSNHVLASREDAMDKLVPGLEANEYGKMPASYHSNSQKVAPTIIATDAVGDNTPDQNGSPKKPSGTSGKPIREPILPRNEYDGVDSDDESDEEVVDDESEEEMPQIVGEIEIDMGEEEEEFLEFSRQALGISDEQWNEILQDRKGRGAFVPKYAKKANTVASEASSAQTASKTAHDTIDSRDKQEGTKSQSGLRLGANPDLNSFEAVMSAMDAELSRLRTAGKSPHNASKSHAQPLPQRSQSTVGKGKEKAEVGEEDIEAAMEAELKAALEKGEDDESGEEDEPMDYNLIKNFLESFKSQSGLSGPVSNLAGMLQPGFQFPRDEL